MTPRATILLAQLGRGPCDLRQAKAALLSHGLIVTTSELLRALSELVASGTAERCQEAGCWRLSARTPIEVPNEPGEDAGLTAAQRVIAKAGRGSR